MKKLPQGGVDQDGFEHGRRALRDNLEIGHHARRVPGLFRHSFDEGLRRFVSRPREKLVGLRRHHAQRSMQCRYSRARHISVIVSGRVNVCIRRMRVDWGSRSKRLPELRIALRVVDAFDGRAQRASPCTALFQPAFGHRFGFSRGDVPAEPVRWCSHGKDAGDGLRRRIVCADEIH